MVGKDSQTYLQEDPVESRKAFPHAGEVIIQNLADSTLKISPPGTQEAKSTTRNGFRVCDREGVG